MVEEFLIILSFVTFGSILVQFLGVKGLITPFLGFLVGVFAYILLGLLLVVMSINTSPLIALIAMWLLIPSLIIVDKFTHKNIQIKVAPALIIVVGIMLMVAIFWKARLFNWHVDSFFNMEIGSVLYSNEYATTSMARITKRLLATPFIHSAAHIGSGPEFYIRSFTPLLSLSTIAITIWIAYEGLKSKISKNTLFLTIAAGIVFMITINRYVFHSFYINGHLLFASCLLIISGFSWLLSINKPASGLRDALIVILCLSIPVLVLTRPEATLVATLAILPLTLNTNIPFRRRAVVLMSLSLSIFAWSGYMIFRVLSDDGSINIESKASMLIGLTLLLSIPFLKLKILTNNGYKILLALEACLWIALFVFIAIDPEIMRQSLHATLHNTVLGSWGLSLLWLVIIFGALIALYKTPGQHHLRFPITTFVVLGFLLAYIRDGAYRIGDGDSFTRMLIQIVPLTILFVIVAIASGAPRFQVKKSKNFTRFRVSKAS